MTCIIQLKQRCDGFTLMRTDESGGVDSHLSCENQAGWKIQSLLPSLCPPLSPLSPRFPEFLQVFSAFSFSVCRTAEKDFILTPELCVFDTEIVMSLSQISPFVSFSTAPDHIMIVIV